MMRGDASIVSGLENKIKDQLGDLMQDTLRAKQAKKSTKPSIPSESA